MTRRRKHSFTLLLVTLLIGAGSALRAQSPALDSLKLALRNASHDTTRCNILDAMVELEPDDNIWSVYNNQLLELAKKNLAFSSSLKSFYLKQEAAALNNIGFYFSERGDSRKALQY
ncbi:MAG: hypothetical protein H0W61_16670, partial [Bacteroidetes bacterium]|nr:hypothetical protein [Bacteroidota bacterium]